MVVLVEQLEGPSHELLSLSCQANAPAITSYKRAVIVAKKTRWDFEQEKRPDLSVGELKRFLASRGTKVEDLLLKKQQQEQFILEHIVKRLEQCNIQCVLLTANNYPEAVKSADLVISAGGDGTFLTAAAEIMDNVKPIIGINTDPRGSEGHLCLGRKNPPTDFIERFILGKFRWQFRSRIRVTVLNSERGCACEDTGLALNEVFVGESESTQVSYYEVSMNDGPLLRQKSSGLVVCTGSGSSAWNLSINRYEVDRVHSIIDVLNKMGALQTHESAASLAADVADRLNSQLVFDANAPNMGYSIREPIFNHTFPRMDVRGYASKIKLKSRCSNAFLVLDGHRRMPFKYDTEVLLEICDSDALRTIELE